MLSRVLLRSNKRALIERTSSSIRAFGSGGGDGHFQPPFVQRARDTRKVRFFCFLSHFFCFCSLWESRVHFWKKKNGLLEAVSERFAIFSLRTRSTMNIFLKTHAFCDMYTHTHIFLFPWTDSRAGRACMGRRSSSGNMYWFRRSSR